LIVGILISAGGLALLLGSGRGDERLFEVWPLLALAALGLAAAVAWLAYRRSSRPPVAPAPTGSLLQRAAVDGASLLLVTAVLGITVVIAWVAIGGTEVFQGPFHASRTRGLLIAAPLALLAGVVGAVLARSWPGRMSTEGLVGLGFAAWVAELLVLLLLGPVIADELGRGVGVVVSTWVLATAGVVQPVAFVLGGVLGRHLRPDRRGPSRMPDQDL